MFTNEEDKEAFKTACSKTLEPVQCTEVIKGSIIVTLLGTAENVTYWKETLVEGSTLSIEGYDEKFIVLQDDVSNPKTDDGSNIGGMSQAVFFILIALVVIICMLSIILAKMVFNLDFGMKNDGGGGKGMKRCWPYGGPALSVNSMDVEDGTGVELVGNDTDKRHPGSTDLENKSLPALPGGDSEDSSELPHGAKIDDEDVKDEEVLESQIVEIQSLLAQRHILDPHKVFELEEELGGLRTLKAFITQDSERL